MTYAVTGSTGQFGALAIQHLVRLRVPAASIVAIARNEAKTADLKKLGVQVRIADYTDQTAMLKALRGVDRLLLVSGSELGQRAAQHRTVIDAAKAAGITLVAYTSIAHCDSSTNILAPEHQATEAALKSSGIPHVLLRNNWYLENYANDLKLAKGTGVIAAAVRTGKVAAACRTEYAEAAARVLSAEAPAGKVYELSGPVAWDFDQLAAAASQAFGRAVVFTYLTPAERKAGLLAAGLPEGVAEFVTGLDLSTEAGSLAQAGGDLEKLLGRAPLSLRDGIKALAL